MPKMFKVSCCVLQLAVNLSARAWALLSVSCKHLFLSILSSSFLTTWHSDDTRLLAKKRFLAV